VLEATVGEGPTGIAGLLILLTIDLFFFVLCLRKYRNPTYRRKKAKQREQQKAWEKEAEKLKLGRTTVVSTQLMGDPTVKRKTRVGMIALRGIIGAIFTGSEGATWLGATTKDKKIETQRFLVTYLDGHTEEKETVVGGLEYHKYLDYLNTEK
jgi:hypothetical protein